mmetsp:Transcript_15703/g.24108  ORF Transcript_15703/g.24108 Transcript_15703/m.24108 type:complete len:117 (-) Transcript_15703:567-917(-)
MAANMPKFQNVKIIDESPEQKMRGPTQNSSMNIKQHKLEIKEVKPKNAKSTVKFAENSASLSDFLPTLTTESPSKVPVVKKSSKGLVVHKAFQSYNFQRNSKTSSPAKSLKSGKSG